MANTSRENGEKPSADFERIQMASHIADILSMYTRYCQQTGNQRFAKTTVPHLSHLITNAIAAPSYNSSLHRNLRLNFESRFLGCKLSDFKRTMLRRPELGKSFYYDLELAHKVLAYDPAWIGKKGQGFAEELRRANLNLSVVEAQINLFHSWKTLLVEFSETLGNEPKFQQIMATAIVGCLKTNTENTLPETVYEKLAQSRADLAFTLLQRLLEAKSTEVQVRSILPEAWNAVRKRGFELNIVLTEQDAEYYRMLLRILYLSLEVHTLPNPKLTQERKAEDTNPLPAQRWSSTPQTVIQTALEILSTTVAQGFRSLVTLLHESRDQVFPSDFSLLTAILRTIFRIPDLTRNTKHLYNAFADAETSRCASALLSWSDQLATSGDPIYGELSVTFLVEMSSVAVLAESLAVEGILSRILSANLIQLLRSRSFGPFDQPLRIYGIWARGFLPLLLNLLTAVGAPVAAEIAAALNNFPNQLDRASNVFGLKEKTDGNPGNLTLTMAMEAQSLALICTILQTFREAGASVSIRPSQVEDIQWDRVQVKEEAEGWLLRRGALRERIVPTNEREEAWSRSKPLDAKGGADNRLEEKVVREMKAVIVLLSAGNGED